MRKVTPEELPPPSHRGRYDWSFIFSGDIIEMVQGEDFPGSTRGFSSNVYTKARMMGVKVSIRNPEPNVLWIKSLGPRSVNPAAGDVIRELRDGK